MQHSIQLAIPAPAKQLKTMQHSIQLAIPAPAKPGKTHAAHHLLVGL